MPLYLPCMELITAYCWVKAKYLGGLLFGVVQFSRAPLLGLPAVEPQRNAAAVEQDTNWVTGPQLKQRLKDSQTAGVLY